MANSCAATEVHAVFGRRSGQRPFRRDVELAHSILIDGIVSKRWLLEFQITFELVTLVRYFVFGGLNVSVTRAYFARL